MSYGLKKTTYKAVRGFQGLVGHYTKGQKLVAEAVEPKIAWGPETGLMDRIAELTRDPAECGAILAMIWENIGRTTTKKWKLIYKNLLLLEHLLTYASPACVRQIQDNVYRVRALANYVYKDKNGNDQGVNVRKRSAAVADLATDEDLADVRRRAQENKERYRGMGGGRGGYSSGYSSGGYGGYSGHSSSSYSSSSSASTRPAPRNQETFVEQPPPADLVARAQPQPPAPAPAPVPAPAPAPVSAWDSQGAWGAPQQQPQPQQPVDLWGAPQAPQAQQVQQPQQVQQQALVDLFAPAPQQPRPQQQQQQLPPLSSQPQQPQRDPLADLFGPSPQAPARPLDRAPARSPLDSLFDM